ncbi:MAG: hypothetical protein WCK48_02765 [bacterium]
MGKENIDSQEFCQEVQEQALWHENVWAKNWLKKFNEKSPLLANVATRFMNAFEYWSRESAAPGPKEASIHNYDYSLMERTEPRYVISHAIGPIVGVFAGMYGFVKGGEVFEILKEKYKLK